MYEANVTDPEGYKNDFLKVVAPKLAKHGIKYVTRGGPAKALMGEPPKNRLVITQAKDMDTVISFWNDSKDDFQNIATKHANGIRWYAVEGPEQNARMPFVRFVRAGYSVTVRVWARAPNATSRRR